MIGTLIFLGSLFLIFQLWRTDCLPCAVSSRPYWCNFLCAQVLCAAKCWLYGVFVIGAVALAIGGHAVEWRLYQYYGLLSKVE